MQAVENGLADEIGTFEDALAYAAEVAGISDYYEVVNISYMSYEFDFLSMLLVGDLSLEEYVGLQGVNRGPLAYSNVGVATQR